MSNRDSKAGLVQQGAVELHEAQLEQASGGTHDFYLQIDGVKGESSTKPTSATKPAGGANAVLGDGSVKFVR